jgi:hypothetical protein
MHKIQEESHYTFLGNTIAWIEKLQTAIDDYRKNAVIIEGSTKS